MLSSAAILSFASSAFALDGNDLLKKINDAYAQQGGSLAAESIDVSGTTVTLKGVSFKSGWHADGFKLGDIALTGVAEAGGGYHRRSGRFSRRRHDQGRRYHRSF